MCKNIFEEPRKVETCPVCDEKMEVLDLEWHIEHCHLGFLEKEAYNKKLGNYLDPRHNP